MKYHTRKWVKPEDLNPNHTLFGGRLLEWIDEEAEIFMQRVKSPELHEEVNAF